MNSLFYDGRASRIYNAVEVLLFAESTGRAVDTSTVGMLEDGEVSGKPEVNVSASIGVTKADELTMAKGLEERSSG